MVFKIIKQNLDATRAARQLKDKIIYADFVGKLSNLDDTNLAEAVSKMDEKLILKLSKELDSLIDQGQIDRVALAFIKRMQVLHAEAGFVQQVYFTIAKVADVSTGDLNNAFKNPIIPSSGVIVKGPNGGKVKISHEENLERERVKCNGATTAMRGGGRVFTSYGRANTISATDRMSKMQIRQSLIRAANDPTSIIEIGDGLGLTLTHRSGVRVVIARPFGLR